MFIGFVYGIFGKTKMNLLLNFKTSAKYSILNPWNFIDKYDLHLYLGLPKQAHLDLQGLNLICDIAPNGFNLFSSLDFNLSNKTNDAMMQV